MMIPTRAGVLRSRPLDPYGFHCLLAEWEAALKPPDDAARPRASHALGIQALRTYALHHRAAEVVTVHDSVTRRLDGGAVPTGSPQQEPPRLPLAVREQPV